MSKATEKQTTATTEKKQSRAEQTEAKKELVIKLLTSLKYETKATENDTNKKKRFAVVSNNKTLCSIVYSAKDAKIVRIKASIAYKNSEYHAGWAAPYSSEVDYTSEEFKQILIELAEAKQKKAEQKAEQKQKKQSRRKATTEDLQKKATKAK